MSQDRKNVEVGELTPSQLMFTYGIGSIVDLPQISVLVTGLDDWPQKSDSMRPIVEDRLLTAVRYELGGQVVGFRSLPVDVDNGMGLNNPFDGQPLNGVSVTTFPRWLVCPSCRTLAPVTNSGFALKSNPFHPDRTHYVHENCGQARNKKAPTALPARFLVACENGHLDDFPWVHFVHKGAECLSPFQ